MEGGVFFEHGHRMVAATVGFLTIILAVWTARSEPRAWVRRLGWGMLAAVILQGLLGGLTVLMKLPDAVSVSHAGLAEIFFALTVIMASVTSPRWQQASATSYQLPATSISTPALATTTAVAIYLQILLGAVVRHTGAGLVIPDFPLNQGGLLPAFTSHLVAWHFAHRAGAVVVLVMIGWLVTRIRRAHAGEQWLRRPAAALAIISVVQILLGAATIWSSRAVTPTTAHVATGALLWATSVLLALRAHRLMPAAAAAERPALVAEAAAR